MYFIRKNKKRNPGNLRKFNRFSIGQMFWHEAIAILILDYVIKICKKKRKERILRGKQAL